MSFSTYTFSFILNKHYLSECYEESALIGHSLFAYRRALIIITLAIALMIFTGIDLFISIFIFAIGVIDAAGIYYHKTWWLARQAISSSYNSTVDLTINPEGISTKSHQASNTILWANIKQVQLTDKGLLIHHEKGQSYISASVLSSSAIEYIRSRAESKGQDN